MRTPPDPVFTATANVVDGPSGLGVLQPGSVQFAWSRDAAGRYYGKLSGPYIALAGHATTNWAANNFARCNTHNDKLFDVSVDSVTTTPVPANQSFSVSLLLRRTG